MVAYIRSDLDFILAQIKIAEANADGQTLRDILPNVSVPWGLRTVSGIYNNLLADQSQYGAADGLFPRMLDPQFLPGYDSAGMVTDADPRIISNLIVDQTTNNPAVYAAAFDAGADGVLHTADDVLKDGVRLVTSPGLDGVFGTADDTEVVQIDNVAPDVGLTAPFNQWMTFFGQFFDHGLDLVTKGGNEIVFMPLQPDDPLYVEGSPTNFMVLTRASQTITPGADGILGTADDGRESSNTTSPFVDQNQTYGSHASQQVFLRGYELGADGPLATGKLIENRSLGADGEFGTADDVEIGGMATWAVVKAQARDVLGINLTDRDVFNVPLLATDEYGNFIKGPNGFPQVVMLLNNGADGIAGTADDITGLVEGDPTANGGLGIDLTNALRTGHAFLNDINHYAEPTGNLQPDADTDVGNLPGAGFYDNELLDAHYVAGDGRVNENIGLTAVHAIFHSEHNRLVQETKDVALSSNDMAFLSEWLMPGTAPATFPVTQAEIAALQWNGERLFQAAKFGTEMQYQHLVFEEFARTIQPNVDGFLAPNGYDVTIDPSIVAEFAHTVYRFGHSMLVETVDRYDADFNTVNGDPQLGLIAAFLNPLAYSDSGLTPEEATGAIVRGATRQAGNEIDEFVTEALRNNLLGLPLDLAAINIARSRDAGIPSLNAARRDFYAQTGDSQLKPYISWVDLLDHLKHPESLINFIAAYGTHAELLAADVDTLAEKRAVAVALVLGGSATINAGTAEERTFTADENDRLAFLNSEGIYANNPTTGVTTTGVDAIDFWVGGLAEEQMPFGGFLGATFNFVFETQLENLQNGDRFYYLSRTAGMHFGTELEQNSFANLIMLNSDAAHLPSLVFLTPTFTLEVDQSRQFNDGLGHDDPTGGILLTDLVIRDNPDTPGSDTNYLQYTGEDHVVMGGTVGADIIIAGDGDDTVYGDGGNDRIEGGYGNDRLFGGSGDDIIEDAGGDNVIHGGDGNDVIVAGKMMVGGVGQILFGEDGKDFIITTEDITTSFGGTGDDFILGAKTNLPPTGNEGDDWIEWGTQDGAPGDNFAPLLADDVLGNDIFLGGGGFDEMIGEGGDDIFVGSDAQDKMDGMSGFDWVTYKNDKQGVTVDLRLPSLAQPHGVAGTDQVGAFGAVGASPNSILDRFAEVEGLSGSAYSDILYGDDVDAVTLINHGGATGGALTNVSLINNLDGLLNPGATGFATGNIMLGGGGSDLVQGNGGDDLIDGDKWLNVRISVRQNSDGTGPEIATFDSMVPLIPFMISGQYNPGQLVAVREIIDDNDGFDTAVYRGTSDQYQITDMGNGVWTVADTNPNRDGTDTLKNVERLQFADGNVVLVEGLNEEAQGSPTINDANGGDVTVGDVLTASSVGLTDADNITATNPDGEIRTTISYTWQADRGTGVFEDIITIPAGDLAFLSADGSTFKVTADLAGAPLRLKAVYQDAHGVSEVVFSTPTGPVAAGAAAPPPTTPVPVVEATEGGAGIHLARADLDFVLDQIRIAEAHAGGASLGSLLPNIRMALGLRTVDGSENNLAPGQNDFGAADTLFPRITDAHYRPAEAGTTYDSSGFVMDSQPRTISNLIVDQTSNNMAAYAAAYDAGADGQLHTADDVLKDGVHVVASPGLDGDFGTADDVDVFEFDNVSPDAGLSAPFNAWMTFFGQFFDHGLDLVTKGGNSIVFIPLNPDDPLYDPAPGANNFMVVTRATQHATPGADGVLGTADDGREAENTTTPFVDQNQTYSSHPSHQVFLRAYATVDGAPVATGGLITNRDLGADGKYGTADDVEIGGMATWEIVKAQARDILGINLTDANVFNVPLLATDAYGNFIMGPNGFPQVVMKGADGLGGTADDFLVEGNPAAPISLANAVGTTHQFLIDIAHSADPSAAPGLVADSDSVINSGPQPAGTYDDELLDKHYIAGDGRVNENIGLTTVHAIFHSEHNRLLDQIKGTALSSNDVSFLNEWLLDGHKVTEFPDTAAEISGLVWNGERLFQAAKFGTEMQYQHLVFEEFARTIQPNVDLFFAPTQVYDVDLDPSIVAEFAHTVYRFGHSMLTETVDRYDADFNPIGNGDDEQMGLIAAFLNPLAYAASGATPEDATSAIVRGLTRQTGNEIDEFVTEALRNNLVGLPLDLAAINIARGREAGVATLNEVRREIYSQTGDSDLKPYRSWADLVQHLKHPESLINFIAAYGTHPLITGEATLEGKRDAAMAIVFGTSQQFLGDPNTTADDRTIGVPSDALAFLNGTGAWANQSGGVTVTGVDDIDLWIGGLAEEKTPFGGMLGSTFNFVFENQLEKLQDGDRFYYLERTSGLAFNAELESNSFAKLIMANTDATHLPAIAFLTPAWTLEVDPTKQHTGLGTDGRADPTGDNPLLPEVLRDNPDTVGPDSNYLYYRGVEHVVLGGTEGRDILIASEGDDTLWGDGGNDRLDGGYGNDQVRGGAGDDVITDLGGDDNIQGGDGNDVIHGGNGINLLIGGFGQDFIVTGEDSSEAIGGQGNDFILGTKADEQNMGNEGDDWIEGGTADGAPGDNFDPFGNDPIRGNDIMVGSGEGDKFNAEGGDDIMVGSPSASDRYIGASGYDWATYKNDTMGVNIDITDRFFDQPQVPGSPASILSRFDFVEGISGSKMSDVLRGDDSSAATLATAGAQGSILTNIGLINGLQTLLDTAYGSHQTFYDGGNIILGGAGSDIIEGRGGDDVIDGDKWLNVRVSVRANSDGTGAEVATFDSLKDLVPFMISGQYNPGQLVAVREILQSATPDFDTAQFSGDLSEYAFQVNGVNVTVAQLTTPGFVSPDAVVTVIGTGTIGATDGTDRLTHIERLQFADQAIVLNGANNSPVGNLSFSNDPTEGLAISVSIAGVTDGDNPAGGHITGAVDYYWQSDNGTGVFTDILGFGAGEVARTHGATFTPTADLVGQSLRVHAVYRDAHGVLEDVYSDATGPVANVNFAPVGALTIGGTPAENQILTAINSFTDADGLISAIFNYQWQSSADGVIWDDIPLGTLPTFAPDDAQVGLQLRVVVSYTDDQGTTESLTSGATAPIANVNDLPLGSAFFDGDPVVGTPLTVIQSFIDDDGLPATLHYTWKESADGGATWTDIAGAADSATFTPGVPQNGHLIQAVISYTDLHGTSEQVASDPSIPVELAPDNLPVGVMVVSDTSPTETLVLTASVNFTDADGLAGVTLNHQWQRFDGVNWVNIPGATSSDFTPTQAEVNSPLRVMVSYVDNGGHPSEVFSDSTIVTGDFVNGTAADETIFGTEGQDILNGNGGADVINARGENDLVNGGAGDDRFIAAVGDGNDSYIGGIGIDTLDLSGTSAGANVTTSLASSADIGADTVASLDNIIGSQGNDTIVFDTGVNVIDGQGGDDNIWAGIGNDTILGGAGNDILAGWTGDDTITGGSGNDTIDAGANNDTINNAFGDGNDAINGGTGSDTFNFTGRGVNDTLTVLYSGTALTNVAGNTLLSIEAVNANMLGGTDVLNYGATTAAIAVNLLAGTASGFASLLNVENVTGGTGNDVLAGNNGANVLNGGAGNDRFVASVGDGNDSYIGDIGIDTLDLSATTAGANVTTSVATSAQIGNDTVASLDNIIGSQGNDTITFDTGVNVIDGQGGDDTIWAGTGDDTILGGAGNDSLTGFSGNDAITGGIGNDTIDAGTGNDTVNYTIGDGTDAVNGGTGTDTFALTGRAVADTLTVLYNGAPLTNVAGNTLTSVEAVTADLLGGTDLLSYGATTAAVSVNLLAGTASGFTSVAGIENVTGGSGNDTITGNTGANVLNGGAGDDRFIAAAGDGNDSYVGGAGIDTLDLSATTAGANVTTSVATSAQIGNDTVASLDNIIGSQGNDTITFDTGVNVLDGQGGDDTIWSGIGNDTIIGGAGNDVMTGANGSDTFIFGSGFGQDRITDFSARGGNQDHLRLDASLGITAANFAAHVTIAAQGANTLITIDGSNTILLNNVSAADVTTDDFLLG